MSEKDWHSGQECQSAVVSGASAYSATVTVV
jgi:hypothetical protein